MKVSPLLLFVFSLLTALCRADDAPQSAAMSSVLPADDLTLMDKIVGSKGKKKDIGADVTAKLGLPAAANSVLMISVKEPATGFVHVFGHLPNGEMLFSFLDKQSAYTYRIDPDLKIISSIQMTSDVASSIVYPDQSLKKELLWWKNEMQVYRNQ